MDAFVQVPYELSYERLGDVADPRGDVHEAAVSSIEAARVRRLVGGLPQLERHVICWRYGLGGESLSVRQVAARLGVSLGGAWKIEQRALEQLRGHYGLAEAA